jgi:hypothetical protein
MFLGTHVTLSLEEQIGVKREKQKIIITRTHYHCGRLPLGSSGRGKTLEGRRTLMSN